ncbi:voltage-gated monoatomic cation channel TMEM109 isoform X2 [Misgurnus anguillicaudatus]|uniref:voltage-gated monoatomic cation channel TMEM109 isoform X2 n=1 Tax=Misgurnus anguillicaudatus TaxID=75329 RepID=UPI003CCF21DF
MSFHICVSRSSQTLLVFGVLFLVLPVLCHGLEFTEKSNINKLNIDSVIMEPLDGLRQYVESVVGTHAIQMGVEFVEMLMKFVAEGAASGLNVIAVYVSEILRATGVSEETISIPHFTAEGVYSVIKWALLALIGYWILTVVLRVTLALVRRVFWLLKAILVLWVFMRIVNDPTASTNITTLRLTLLVLICAVFGVTTSRAGGSGDGLEKRVRNLEGRLQVMEKTKTESD